MLRIVIKLAGLITIVPKPVMVGVIVVPNIFDGFLSLLSMLLINSLFMVSATAIILNIVFNFNDIKRSFRVN